MISDAEYLERIVAGINALANPGAEVQWDVEIAGRQFDVMIKFTAGLHRFMVLVEVKNHVRKTTVQEIESFITKAKDQLADKITFFTRAGYQSGAIEVAKRHNVDLFQVSFVEGQLEDAQGTTVVALPIKKDGSYGPYKVEKGLLGENRTIERGAPQPIHAIERCKLFYDSEQVSELPDESTQMEYYANESVMADGKTLKQLIAAREKKSVPFGTTSVETVVIAPAQAISPPDEYFFPSGILVKLELTITGKMGRPLSGNTKIEPTALAPRVEYKNVVTEDAMILPAHSLPVGEKALHQGKYYCQYFPLRYFHCDAVSDGMVTVSMIESFQSAKMITGSFTQSANFSSFYMRVRDKEILKRLRKRLIDYRKKPRASPPERH